MTIRVVEGLRLDALAHAIDYHSKQAPFSKSAPEEVVATAEKFFAFLVARDEAKDAVAA